jgi:hypothetical protein
MNTKTTHGLRILTTYGFRVVDDPERHKKIDTTAQAVWPSARVTAALYTAATAFHHMYLRYNGA